jgi:short-subunit dehydrogenase
MLERGEGDFINFASMAGWLPTLYMGAYDASKFAVVAFSEILYHENRNQGVRFACV